MFFGGCMSIASKVLSEIASIRFNVHGTSYNGSFKEACAYVQDLLTTVNKTELEFSKIVTCRSVVWDEGQDGFSLEQYMCDSKGPLTPEQILNMMQYESGISMHDWYQHMAKAGGVQVVQQ
jgi:hypothetical protein